VVYYTALEEKEGSFVKTPRELTEIQILPVFASWR